MMKRTYHFLTVTFSACHPVPYCAAGMPSAACFKINAFWAAENLDTFIALRSSQPGNHRGKL
jgi:hypothetical protein